MSGQEKDKLLVSLERKASLSESEQSHDNYIHIPYGFQSKACYKPKSKNREITGVTYNSRTRQFVVLDPKGVTSWSYHNVVNSISRLLDYPSYQFNQLQLLLHSKKYNVYFGLSCDYALKVFNMNFHEVFSVVSDMNSVLCMVFNSVTDELITGGTAGVKFWSFGEITTKESHLMIDSKPMSNYGLILRFEHPGMSGSWVKDILLDESNQRLYCLSERNVYAYDMEGNFLFSIKNAHHGLVTGSVYSKFSDFVVTAGSDCAVNVWSTTGGCVHSFTSHSKTITNLLIHPQSPSLIISSSEDGSVKIFSLDIMEEIYSHVVFPEPIIWMNCISKDILYCASALSLDIFSINHILDFWTTTRCPLKELNLLTPHKKSPRIMAVGCDNSARLISHRSHLLSIVLPPPAITTLDQSIPCVGAYVYWPLFGLMYLLVNRSEIWVYYTKTNPANRVEVWCLSEVKDIHKKDVSQERLFSPYCGRTSSQRTASPVMFSSPNKIVDNVACLTLEFLDSPITECVNQYPEVNCYLIAGLEDGRALFLSPFAATVMYYQMQITKGMIVSVKHDLKHRSLFLKTVTLDDVSIQIRSLPDLELQHAVSVGNNITCFNTMGDLFMSGYQTGRVHLQTMTDQLGMNSGHKSSHDHSDVVLSVDSNQELALFCSSGKDGLIKIWNDRKVLLRDITLDNSLTMVCFLNWSGDLLAGFKNHIFLIKHEKVHLMRNDRDFGSQNGGYETASEVYEDARVRFDSKKRLPSEPTTMETYLVPFANISVNLARYISGYIPDNELEDIPYSDGYETGSEMSDPFSIPATDIYSSQSGTPLSRSRSSSMVNPWGMPMLGSSPVASPPRTPPPVVTPTIRLESDDDVENEGDVDIAIESKNTTAIPLALNQSQVKEQGQIGKSDSGNQKNTSALPSRNRTGISQVKINSQSLKSRQKNWKEYKQEGKEKNGREDYENIRKLNSEKRNVGIKQFEKVEYEVERRQVKVKRAINESKDRYTTKQREIIGKPDKQDKVEKNYESKRSNKRVTIKKSKGDFVRRTRTRDRDEMKIMNVEDSEVRKGNRLVSNEGKDSEKDANVDSPAPDREILASEDLEGVAQDGDETECMGMTGSVNVNQEEFKEELGETSPGNIPAVEQCQENEIISNESDDSSDQDSSSDDNDTGIIDQITTEVPSSTKTVTFQENIGDSRNETKKAGKAQKPHSSLRNKMTIHRSNAPVTHVMKVVPVESRLYGDERSSVTSSSMRLYSLARSRRRAVSACQTSNDTNRKSGMVPLEECTTYDVDQKLYDNLHHVGTEMKTWNHKEHLKTCMNKEERVNENNEERRKQDVMSWCLRALAEKGPHSYPVFLPKPKLPSRKSQSREKTEKVEKDSKDKSFPIAGITDSPEVKESTRVTNLSHMEEYNKEFDEGDLIHNFDRNLIERQYSRADNSTITDEYGAGWQERQLLRAKLLKEKRRKRELLVIEQRQRDLNSLEEKRKNIYHNCTKTDSDFIRSCTEENMSKPESEINFQVGYANEECPTLPYRLQRLNSPHRNTESFLHDEYTEENVLEFPVRPKSAASIPSKCRKFMLVSTQLESVQESPQIKTTLEQTLLLKRFPNSKIKPESFRIKSAFRRPHSVAKMRTEQTTCK